MPTLTETENEIANDEAQGETLVKDTVSKEDIESVTHSLFDLGEATPENKARRKELRGELIKLLNVAGMDKEQRLALIAEVSKNRNSYAKLLSFNTLEQALQALPLRHKGNRTSAFVDASRADVALREKGELATGLIEEAARVIEIDLPPPYALRFSFTEAIRNCVDIAKKAMREKGATPTTLQEAAKLEEVSKAIKELYKKINSLAKIPENKKRAIFVFLKEATGIAYEPSQQETAEELVADAA